MDEIVRCPQHMKTYEDERLIKIVAQMEREGWVLADGGGTLSGFHTNRSLGSHEGISCLQRLCRAWGNKRIKQEEFYQLPPPPPLEKEN
jgi:hypothetical protein